MSEQIVPMPGYVLVARQNQETVTPGGIHIPDSAQRKSMRCEILAVSPFEHSLESTEVQRLGQVTAALGGCVVLVKQGVGVPVHSDGRDLLLVETKDLIGVVGPPGA